MVSQVLLRHVARTALVVVGLVALVVGGLWGVGAAIGVVIGGALMVLDGAALVYLVGRLMDPSLSGRSKGLFTAILVLKLALVAGILWIALSRFGSDAVGILFGVGAGLAALVWGVNQGSTSEAGQAAIRDEEAKISEQMGDNETEMR